MWYFTPKSELRFLENFKDITKEFIACRAAVASLEPQGGKRSSRSESEAYNVAIEKRDKARTEFLQQQGRAFLLCKKYGVQAIVTVWVYTIAYEKAQADVFTAVNEKNVAHLAEVEQRAVDTIERCIGMCKDRIRTDFWHLVNPLYWLYAGFQSLFISSGLSKPLGESITKLLSKALTAAVVAATPWLKQFAESWFKKLTS